MRRFVTISEKPKLKRRVPYICVLPLFFKNKMNGKPAEFML